MKKWIIAVGTIVVLGMGWYLVSPLFIDKVVDEAPIVAGSSSEKSDEMKDDMKGEEMKDDMKDEEMKDDMKGEEMKDDMKDEEMKDDMKGEEMKDDMKDEEMKDDMKDEEMKDDMANVFKGTFKDADSSHKASGDVKVENGYVRLENFEVTNGPDLRVYLVKEGQETKDGISLGKLKGNIGNQNYELPEGTKLMEGMQIVIWCKQFDVDFGYAELNKGE
ncbi:DM13 domain-containing protein [Bacillus spongiae]|uniref:DM13 domain-containing protein n=1 Tax=Bacillus spongiae TaxID=2683610 RepID=A0ABU8HF42_9BACI